MNTETKKGNEIANWFETFIKVVCWEYKLEPKIPYHDLAAMIVETLSEERKSARELPWRRKEGPNAG